jgi:hypothetical protein
VRGLGYLSGEEESFLLKDRPDLFVSDSMLGVLCPIAGVQIEVIGVRNEIPQPDARLVITG